ncbi:hypothetical protein DH2020_029982 [Rehmannia glutinosa]|uniref:Uncharacterized protein n=1 Tax=Rehmannia glutinosa TaxID=99300 RepID=A0ABR0VM13_REHGL
MQPLTSRVSSTLSGALMGITTRKFLLMTDQLLVRKATKYDPPPMRKERKAPHVRESKSNIPSRLIIHLVTSAYMMNGPPEKALFSKLGVKESSMEETYLAASIFACWLCLFVLPNDDLNSIRPALLRWRVSWRMGKRRPWLFGFSEYLLRTKGLDVVRLVRLSEPLYLCVFFFFFFSNGCDVLGVEVCESNKRKVAIPSFEESSSSDADHHWKRLKKTDKSLEQQEANGVASNQPLTENFVEELEKQLLDNECEHGSQDSQRSIMGPNLPTVNHQKVTSNSIEAKSSPCAVFSVFQGEKFIRNHQQEYLQKLWGDLREKISNIPIDSLSSIQDEVMIVLESMKSFNIIDISFVEGSLKDLFAKAIAYDEARSSSSEIVSKELLAKQLSKVEDRLHDAKTKEAKESARISSTKEELESINRELDNLRKRKKNLTASLKRQEELLHIAHTKFRLKTRLPPSDYFAFK